MKEILKSTFRIFFKIVIPMYLLEMLLIIPIATTFFVFSEELFAFILAVYNFITLTLIQIASIKATNHYYNREPFTWKETIFSSLKRLFPTIILSILVILSIGLASLLLVIPGIILSVMLLLIFPAFVIENLSIKNAWKRSCELTKNHRWQLFGYTIVAGLLGGLLFLVLLLPLAFAITPFIYNNAATDQTLLVNILIRIVSFPTYAISTAWLSAFVTAIYHKRIREKSLLC